MSAGHPTRRKFNTKLQEIAVPGLWREQDGYFLSILVIISMFGSLMPLSQLYIETCNTFNLFAISFCDKFKFFLSSLMRWLNTSSFSRSASVKYR